MVDHTVLENGYISIPFEAARGPHVYKDALVFAPWEFMSITEAEIEAMKVDRFEKWYAHITYVPTPEEEAAMAAQRAEFEARMAEMRAQQGTTGTEG